MSIRKSKRRICQLRDGQFNQKVRPWSAEEQAWLDVAPVGREFGSPDYERLQILDMFEAGEISGDDAVKKLGLGSLDELNRQIKRH